MKTVALFGAGQIGAMVSRLLGTGCGACCFADNSEEKWGGELAGIPIVSPRDALLFDPDAVCICVMDDERAAQMRSQLDALGYDGEILSPALLKTFDARSAQMRLIAEQINALAVPGDVAELGVFRGDFAVQINAAFSDRTIHLFDTFEGFCAADVDIERQNGYSAARVGDFSETAKDIVDKKLLYRERAVFHKGFFPATFRGCELLRFAFVSIDADLYAPTAAALPLFWERLSPGGALMIHDVYSTQFGGVRHAVDEFCAENDLLPMPVCDLHGSAVIRKPIKNEHK